MKTLVTLLFLCALASAQHVITFSAPDAGSGANQGTFPAAINHNGQITGPYADSTGTYHGFLYSGGTVTEFDPPNSLYTTPIAISANGTITGSYYVPGPNGDQIAGFTRNSAGKFTVIRIDMHKYTVTIPTAINTSGEIAGFGDTEYVQGYQGFVWTAKGGPTLFFVPGSADTYVYSMNDSGTVTGSYYLPESATSHGYLRDQFGNVTTFDPPNAAQTYPQAINAAGVIAGYYTPFDATVTDVFIRDAEGNFTIYDVPNAKKGIFSILSSPLMGINASGEAVGAEITFGGAFGFSLSPTGAFSEYSFCGTSTALSGINDVGWTVGYCGDSSFEGFISQ